MSEIAIIPQIEVPDGVFSAQIKLRIAVPTDLKHNNFKLKTGFPYWQRSIKTGLFDQRTYFLSEDTDLYELATMLNLKMIYVAINWRDEQIK